MDVKITRENPILVKAAVQIPWERVAPHQNKALQEIKGHAQLPGFRKGKAPAALLKKRFKNEITQEIIRHLLPDCMKEVVESQKLKSVTTPRLVDVELVDKKHFHFEAEIDVKPEIELQEWKGLEAETLRIDITAEQVDQALETKLEQATKREKITDRGAENGDRVKAALTVVDLESDESLTDMDDYEVELGAEGAHPNISELILGAETGDDVVGEFEAGEDDAFPDWAGKKVKAYLEIKEIVKETKPELNDEFAKTLDAEDLADLRKKTEEDLKKSAEDHEKHRLDNFLMGKMMEGYDFQVPREWVTNEARAMVEQQMAPYMQALQGQGRAQQEELIGSMLQYTMPQAAGKVRADVILDTLAENLEIAPSDEELDADLETYLPYSQAETVEELKATLTESGALENIIDVIKRRKALDAVREAAVLTEVDELTKEEPPAEEEHVQGHDHDHGHEEAAAETPETSGDDTPDEDNDDESKDSA
ncbi:MAG: trigger factor [Acidobacteriota bacterium]|nr:trigger factor [Acidobacteriota bacterium]